MSPYTCTALPPVFYFGIDHNYFLWISSGVKLLKLMQPHLPHSKCVWFLKLILHAQLMLSFIVGYTPDYWFLLQTFLRLDPQVLEINLVTFPNVANAILSNVMFSHYCRPRIALFYGKAGLCVRALQDIKRVIVNTHALEPQVMRALAFTSSTLRLLQRLDKFKEVKHVTRESNFYDIEKTKNFLMEAKLLDARPLINVCDRFGFVPNLTHYLYSNNMLRCVEGCVKKVRVLSRILYSFSNCNSFIYLSIIYYSEDTCIHFKYIEVAAKTGQIKEVERVTRESNFYDTEKIKNFLMEAKLLVARPLINVCDHFGFIPNLTHYLYSNNMLHYVEGYVQKAAKVQLREGLVSEAIESFIRADDATQFLDVVRVAQDADVYHDLVKYLLMIRKKTKEPRVDSDLIYAYAKIDRLASNPSPPTAQPPATLAGSHPVSGDPRLTPASLLVTDSCDFSLCALCCWWMTWGRLVDIIKTKDASTSLYLSWRVVWDWNMLIWVSLLSWVSYMLDTAMRSLWSISN
ncbi:hypothetical protein RHSIM_Rhsim12G0075700 [Rhododendron simsii]|uniref:Uncharacterized protein n=1 Tax=Rhododendron simsii TaxID=118357 RepID=A0A834G4R4_RHOSS|nr:hypothetical protein RHSIM_Rhsim12G0075700 [Rhododendron simsii]